MRFRSSLLFFLLLSPIAVCTAQEIPTEITNAATDTLYRANYPEGVYMTKEDFLNKKPVIRKVWPINVTGLDNKVQPTGVHSCYFYGSDLRKIPDAFAVSHQGHLYFQLKAIFKNCNEDDGNETSNFAGSFVRVIIGGANYLYTEAPLANVWAQGFGYGVGGAIGGAIAQSKIQGKGIVWDFKKQEFNIFRNCKDYNDFIGWQYTAGALDCKDKKQNPYKVRKAIDAIK
jgi:hypothetical protein